MNVNGKNENIKKIPYGIADYELIRTENYYYVDKTMYLVTLRDSGRYLFFIRPRRFGKSLFISLMEFYYDVTYKERFEELFKGTWIYDHPTDDRGSYLVIRFNFSMVDPGLKHIEGSFLKHVKETSIAFIAKHTAFLNVYLGLSNLYIIHTEKEMNKGYADMVMEPFLARYEGIKYSYLLEIKYEPSGLQPEDPRIEKLKAEARKQLNSYSLDNKFKKNMEKTTVIKLILVFSGHQPLYIGL